jgi:hypothetical protein
MVKNRKFINEENKLKCLLQMRKKEEIEQLKEKAEQQKRNRLKTKDLSMNNTAKESFNRSLNRVNTSKPPIHNNLCNNSPEKPLGNLINSKSSSRILENSFPDNRSFSLNNSKFLNNDNKFNQKNNNDNYNDNNYKKILNINNNNKLNDSKINNAISVINNKSNNILHSKIVFEDESSVNTKDYSNIGENDKNNNNYNKNDIYYNFKKDSYIKKQKNSEESKKERKNSSIINKNTGQYSNLEIKIKKAKKPDNCEMNSREDNESLQSQKPAYGNKNMNKARNISCDANNNIKIIKMKDSSKTRNKNKNKCSSKINSDRMSCANPNNTVNNNSKSNYLNQSIDSKSINNSKYYQNNINKNNDKNDSNNLIDCSENSNNQNLQKSQINNLDKNSHYDANNKESLSYKLYNELKNIKKNLNNEKIENNFRKKESIISLGNKSNNNEKALANNNKNSINNLSKSKSTERLSNREQLNNTLNNNNKNVCINIQTQEAKKFLEKNYTNETNKAKVNLTVGFTAKNDKILNNIIDNINTNYKNNANPQINKNKDIPDKQSKNSFFFDYDPELKKEILDNYKQTDSKNNNNNNNNQNKDIYNKSNQNHSEFKNEAYTLGKNECYSIGENSNATNDAKKQINSNEYISKICGEMNFGKREYDNLKITDVKKQKKVN